MATKAAVSAIFHKLLASEVAGGPKSPDTLKVAVEDWVDVLADVTDEDLSMAYRAYRRDPKACQFWPQPGTLIGLIPSRQLAAIDDADEMFTKAMNYLISCPPRWVDPEAPNARYYNPAPGLVPMKYPPPPWPPERHEAVMRATEAMGLTSYTMAEHDISRSKAKEAWIRVYKSAVKEGALAIEGRVVGQITGERRQLTAEAK